MKLFFKIKDLPGLEGLVISCEGPISGSMIQIDEFIRQGTMLGDRIVKYPVPPGAIVIRGDHLEQASDPNMEFSHQSPFGEHMYDGSYEKHKLKINYSVFSNAFSVTISELGNTNATHTLYTQNFFKLGVDAHNLVKMVLSGDVDPEDIIFSLKELKEKEMN